MAFPVTSDSLPLHMDRDGLVRVVATRITLDNLVAALLEGATSEAIVQ